MDRKIRLAGAIALTLLGAGASAARGQCDPQEQTKLIASDAAATDEFGFAVAVSGDTALVGAYWDDDACPMDVNCDSGSAYVFVRTDGEWTQQQKLTAPDAAYGDFFGCYLALSGDTAVITAFDDDDACPMNPSCDSGSAYVFVRSGTVWTFQQKLTASDAAEGDYFGSSVGISGDTVVIGAESDDNGGGANAGAAYIFVRSGGIWTEQKKLIAADATAGAKLGYSAALSGDTAVVGANRDDTAGDVDTGSAYVFVRSGTNWTEQKKLIGSDVAKDDYFGFCVAVSGDTAVVGSPFDDDACPMDALCNSGSAYVFFRTGTDWTEQQKLIPPDGAKDDNFGASVGVSGETIVIGSPYDDNAGANYAGSVFLYVRSGTVWNEQQRLTASDAAADDFFGQSVAISGDTAVVGANGEGNTGPRKLDGTGSAYAFVLGCANDGCPDNPEQTAPDGCGQCDGACGAGTVAMMPLMLSGLLRAKLRQSRRQSQRLR